LRSWHRFTVVQFPKQEQTRGAAIRIPFGQARLAKG
jgi:hypothetical protein